MKKGFTLIELMVAVVISMLLVGAGIAAYRGVGKKQSVKQSGLEFETNFRSIQEKALSSEKPVDCIGDFESYEILYVNTNSYSAQAKCSTNNGSVLNYDLLEGTEFVSNFNNIVFNVLKYGVDSQIIQIKNNDGSFIYNVNIEGGGVISGEFE